MHKHRKTYRFPWRQGNRAALLVDGEYIFPRMLEVIHGAEYSVLLELYLAESGALTAEFIEAFCLAARRGVRVRLLLDGYGGRGLHEADRRRLADAGAILRFYNPLYLGPQLGRWTRNLARDHRKMLLVDERTVFVGGAGLTDRFHTPGRVPPPTGSARSWHEYMLEVQGPVAGDWYHLFAEQWRRVGGESLPEARPVNVAGELRARVETLAGPWQRSLLRDLISRVRGARRRVWLVTAYFIPPWHLRRALRRAARAGLDVRLLLPGPLTDHPAVRHAGRRFYRRLLRDGVRIFEYQPRVLHAKAALCDDWLSLGSSNYDRWNLGWNLEANQVLRDAVFAAELAGQIEADFGESLEITYQDWLCRPWHQRLREWFWGRVDLILLRLGQRKMDD